jgi:molybdate transport system ATP-binding protein
LFWLIYWVLTGRKVIELDMGLVVNITQSRPFPIKAEFYCQPGRVLAIVGPSGSGKTTILRMIAGLHTPESGVISCGNQQWLDTKQTLNRSPQQRRVGLVFQDFALFSHLSVLQNIMLAMSDKDLERGRVLLAQVNLEGLDHRYPETLSGGQKQRVAIARALARNPEVLLLDEPFSAVDQVTRRKLRLEMLQLTRQLNLPIVLVTHDLDEACMLAGQMVVLHHGETLQTGIPQQVLQFPKTANIARLVDVRNLFSAQVSEQQNGQKILQWQGHQLTITSQRYNAGDHVYWCIRPADILLHSRLRPSKGEKENPLAVVITEIITIGGTVSLIVALRDRPDVILHMDLPPHVVDRNQLAMGELIQISLLTKAIHLMPNAT